MRCLQRHPALASRLRKLGESLYTAALLPPRTRTIAILRICALLRCAYEWGGQAAFWGPIAGVSDDECERTGSWSEATWEALGDFLDDEQRIELLTAIGWYRTICTLCNALALPVEGWMRPWPGSAG